MTETPTKREMPLPGVAAIAFYLLLIAGLIIVGVVNGGHYPAAFLFFPVFSLRPARG